MVTDATVSNAQEIDVYVAMEQGLYLYDSERARLAPVLLGDLRPLAPAENLPRSGDTAPVRLIYVADVDRLEKPDRERGAGAGPRDAKGLLFRRLRDRRRQRLSVRRRRRAQRVVPRLRPAGLAKRLPLRAGRRVLFGQTVGYPRLCARRLQARKVGKRRADFSERRLMKIRVLVLALALGAGAAAVCGRAEAGGNVDMTDVTEAGAAAGAQPPARGRRSGGRIWLRHLPALRRVRPQRVAEVQGGLCRHRQGALHLPRVLAQSARRRRLHAGALRRRRQGDGDDRTAVRHAGQMGLRREPAGAAARGAAADRPRRTTRRWIA